MLADDTTTPFVPKITGLSFRLPASLTPFRDLFRKSITPFRIDDDVPSIMEFPLNGYRYPYCFLSLQQPYTSLCVYVSEYPTEMTISTLVTGSRPCVYQIWIPIMTPFVCKLGLADGRFGNIWRACVKTINPLDDITHHRIQSVPDEWQQVGRKNSWDSSFSHSTDFAASPRLCGEDRNGKVTIGQKTEGKI